MSKLDPNISPEIKRVMERFERKQDGTLRLVQHPALHSTTKERLEELYDRGKDIDWSRVPSLQPKHEIKR
jgi:hypothetical protein